MKLPDFMFPVTTRYVKYYNHSLDLQDTEDYEAIVRGDTGALIAINPSTYKLVTNRDLIETTMEQLNKLGVEYKINESHSFVSNERMKLQLEFPEIKIHDGTSDINMSLFIHNSYNQAEGIRILWGAIRSICTNGMIFGTVMKRIYMRHRGKVQERVDKIGEELLDTYHTIPELNNRIKVLQMLSTFPQDMLDQLAKTVGKGITDEAIEELDKETPNWRSFTHWELYNKLTFAISHTVAQHLRTQKQLALGKVFKL
jgi:hypothetical protein